jgi:Mce-associated membrane protein
VSSRNVLTVQEGDTAMSDGADSAADEVKSTDEPESIDEPESTDEVESTDEAESSDEAELADEEESTASGSRFGWVDLLAALLPVLALLLTVGVGYLKWLDGSARESQAAAAQSVRVASDSTIAILSYKPETVDKDLKAAADLLTADFRQQYTQLVNDVVAPGAKQQHISAVATVPAAASVSATEKHAVVLVFVDQTTTVGNDPPTQSTSSVRVTLDKVRERWLISQFDPV